MGKSTPSAPKPADPTKVAAAQTASNVDTATAQAILNNVNQYSPYGSTTYNQIGSQMVGKNSVPLWEQNTELSPLGQQIFDAQGNISTGVLDKVAQQVPNLNVGQLDFNGLPKLPDASSPDVSTPVDFNQLNDAATDAIYGKSKGFLDPQWDRSQKMLEDQLSRQGIPVGSEAYNSAMEQLMNSRTQAYDAAQFGAISEGANLANQRGSLMAGQNQDIYNQGLQSNQNTFNQDLTARQLGTQEQITAQNQPINLLTQLLGGAPQLQTQPLINPVTSNMANTNVVGAYGDYNNVKAQQYAAASNAAAQENAAMWGALGQIGGAGTKAAFSDERLKKDVRRVGTTDGGLPIYIYRFKSGGPFVMGVMAQDVEKVLPKAVMDVGQFKAVDYSQVL